MTDLTQHLELAALYGGYYLQCHSNGHTAALEWLVNTCYAAGRKAGLEDAATHVRKNCVDGDINTIAGVLSSLWEIIALEIIALETLKNKS